MESSNEPFFPSAFILDYRKDAAGRERFFTYVCFRFLSCASETDASLASLLKEKLDCPFTPDCFCVVEDYLAADYYFSPSFTPGSLEPFCLYAAIVLAAKQTSGDTALLDTLLAQYAPVVSSLSYTDSAAPLSSALVTAADFYAALCLCAVHHASILDELLPRFTEAYRSEYHFTCEDYLLFDFMDEYFEQKNCRRHPSFVKLVDTLVAGTLNYYDTDFGTLVEHESARDISGSASRFAGISRFGNVLPAADADTDKTCHMLAALFYYAAVYELRSNLFDFHLDEDRLITLDNWQNELRWHYVQYANVYNLAMDTFHSALLSLILLRGQFAQNLSSL